jgi:hypothetical protein
VFWGNKSPAVMLVRLLFTRAMMNEAPSGSAAKTARKQSGRPFEPGRSGNPNGRPAGSRNKASLAIEELLDGEADAITRKAIELAIAGDMGAIRICMDRICPPRKDRPISFDLPGIKTAADAVTAAGVIIGAVASGEITPSEAGDLGRLIDGYVKALEAVDFEARLAKLERMTSQ